MALNYVTFLVSYCDPSALFMTGSWSMFLKCGLSVCVHDSLGSWIMFMSMLNTHVHEFLVVHEPSIHESSRESYCETLFMKEMSSTQLFYT